MARRKTSRSRSSSGRPEDSSPSARLQAVVAQVIPEAQTIVYIHGIGNKPPADVLKCQWDNALWGHSLGDRSRMAYWVNRAYYPVPEEATCADADVSDDPVTAAAWAAREMMSLSWEEDIDQEIARLAPSQEQAGALRRVAEEVRRRHGVNAQASVAAAAAFGAKVLPLPAPLRDWLTRRLTKLLLRDVNDFLFNEDQRQAMDQSLQERLDAGGGPFVVIAHSQGTMIAYDVLRQLAPETVDVALWLTIGSPLGLQEVRDGFQRWLPADTTWARPACVRRWVNVADKLDPVAAHWDLSDIYANVENFAAFF